MRTQSIDTSPEAERVQIELFRKAPAGKHFAIMAAWSQLLVEANKESIRRQYPGADEKEIGLIFVARHYGQSLANKLRATLEKETIMNQPSNVSMVAAIAPVAEALDNLGVAYLIGGSVASSVHGFVRATIDADIVADLKLVHVQPLVRYLEADYYIDADAIKDAIRHKGSFNVIHFETLLKVDIYIPKTRLFDESVFQRVQMRPLPGDARLFAVSSPEDVILNKLEWYRMGGEVSDRQWNDVLGVLKVQGTNIDLPYLRRWAAALNVADLLERALDDAGLSV